MIENTEFENNPAVVDAIHMLLNPMSNPVNHGDFNNRMFLEAVAIKAGHGCSIAEEDIISHACMTKKEFNIIKDKLIKQGIIKTETNMFGIVLYSMNI